MAGHSKWANIQHRKGKARQKLDTRDSRDHGGGKLADSGFVMRYPNDTA
jgi:transcriptional/translational regulatory protein YebC/TACO1